MKKIMILVSAALLLTTAGFARPRNQARNDLQKLLALHSAEMHALLAGIQNERPALPAFFCDVSFTTDRQVENFLQNVSASAPAGQVYSQVSFTQFVSINGNMRSVSYNLVNNGGNVTFVKSTNINGEMLKAVYEFDAASKTLKTGTFDGKKVIKSSEYSI